MNSSPVCGSFPLRAVSACSTALLLCFAGTAARAAWPTDSNSALVLTNATVTDPHSAAPDGSGGVLVAWSDWPEDLVYVQRVGANGEPVWQANGVQASASSAEQLAPQVMADGAGGAWVAWQETSLSSTSSDIYVQHIAASGTPLLGPGGRGLPVCTAVGVQDAVRLVGDGAGGVILVWRDLRGGTSTDTEIYAQRVGAAGTPLWSINGISAVSGLEYYGDFSILEDGAGGVFIVSLTENGVFGQRISSQGTKSWGAVGTPICTNGYYQDEPVLTGDGLGGIITAYRNRTSSGDLGDLYVQRINAEGQTQWTYNGLLIRGGEDNDPSGLRIVSDHAGGAIVFWEDSGQDGIPGRIAAHRVDGNGSLLWGSPRGLANPLYTHKLRDAISDGRGGALLLWRRGGTFEEGYDDFEYAQHLTREAVPLWGTWGTLAYRNTALNVEACTLVGTPNSGVIAAFQRVAGAGTGVIHFDVRGMAGPQGRTSGFSVASKLKIVSHGEGYQEIAHNYTTRATEITPYQAATASFTYPLSREQWSGVFHFDYVRGAFTQAIYIFRDEF